MSRKRRWQASGWQPLWSFVGLPARPVDADWSDWLICPAQDAPPPPPAGPDDAPLDDIIWAVRRDLARKRAEGHVGNYGTQSGPPDNVRGVPGVRADWPNIAWTVLRSPPVAALHALIGDALFRYILLYCRVLQPAPTRPSVLVQLCGTPLVLGPVAAPSPALDLKISKKLPCDSTRSRAAATEAPREKRAEPEAERKNAETKKRRGKESSDVAERKLAQAQRKRERECRRKAKRDAKKEEAKKREAEGKAAPDFTRARLFRKPPPPRPAAPPAAWAPASDFLPRASLFYNTSSSRRSGLPARHFLNAADDTKAAKLALAAVRGGEEVYLPKACAEAIEAIANEIGKRHRRMAAAVYAQLLAHHAPLPNGLFSRQDAAGVAHSQFTQYPDPSASQASAKSPADYAAFASAYTPIHSVECFLLAVWRRLIPESLYGSDAKNGKHLEHCVSQLVRLRRHESLSVHYLLQKFSLSALAYVPSVSLGPHHQALAQRIAGRLLKWVFAEILIPIVSHSFYATETSLPTSGRLRVFYYRKAVWARLASLSMQQMVMQGRLRPVASEEEAARISGVAKLGAAIPRLRLVPKASKVRPIVNLGSRRHKISVNGLLGNAHAVLSAERKARPHLFGSAIFKTEDAYEGLVSFSRARAALADPRAAVFMCTVDVLNCFDSLKHGPVLAVLEELLSKSEYNIQHYARADVDADGNVIRIHRAEKAVAANPSAAFRFPVLLDSIRTRNCIVTDLARCTQVTRESLLTQLRAHITGHLIKIRGGLYLQREGVPQGSVVSPMLTAATYARLEHELLPPETKRHANLSGEQLSPLTQLPASAPTLLLRHTDDFLLLSTDEAKARHFLLTMDKGFPSYGVRIHPDKSQANFAAHMSTGRPVGKGRGAEGEVSWCGLLLDPLSLEVRVDYSRFANAPTAESLTVEYCRMPGRKFRAKMLQFARAKCHCVLFDSQLNSPFTVRLNVYQAMLFLALRFVAYLRHFDALPGLTVSVLADVIDYVRVRVEYGSRTEQAQRMGCRLAITPIEVYWLGLRAFERILRSHSAKHALLLAYIRRQLHRTAMRHLEKELSGVASDEHSRMLLGMK